MANASNVYEPNFRYPGGAGYSVYAYQIGGTSTPISTYADRAKSATNAYPVVLSADANGDGIAAIYLDVDATLVVKDGAGVTQAGYPKDVLKSVTTADLNSVNSTLAARLDGHDNDIYTLQAQVRASRPVTSVYKVGTQSVTCPTSGTKVTGYTGIEENSAGFWDTSTNKFTPTIAGWYVVSAGLHINIPHPSGDATQHWIEVWKNGACIARGSNQNIGTITYALDTQAATVLYFNGTSDYAEIYYASSGSGNTPTSTVGYASPPYDRATNYFQALLTGS